MPKLRIKNGVNRTTEMPIDLRYTERRVVFTGRLPVLEGFFSILNGQDITDGYPEALRQLFSLSASHYGNPTGHPLESRYFGERKCVTRFRSCRTLPYGGSELLVTLAREEQNECAQREFSRGIRRFLSEYVPQDSYLNVGWLSFRFA